MNPPSSTERDLVGRPLVPYFDQDDEVNDALTLQQNSTYEEMDIDARVWDKDLGYFVYPTTETKKKPSSRSSHPSSSSQPIAIQKKNASSLTRTGSFPMDKSSPADTTNGLSASAVSKLLLTPEMLSSSCPDSSSILSAGRIPMLSSNSQSQELTNKSKSRSSTPVKTRKPSKDSMCSANGNGNGVRMEDITTTTPVHTPNHTGNKDKDAVKKRKGKAATDKQTKQELSASGKWAWSAFQSSPDPKHLPLPPFLASSNAMSSTGKGQSHQPTVDTGKRSPSHEAPQLSSPLNVALHGIPLEGMPVKPPPPPPIPPAGPPGATNRSEMGQASTVEASMTQDLRRMLNIGGG